MVAAPFRDDGISAEVSLPPGLGADDLRHMVRQLACTEQLAIKAYREMNIQLVLEELHCSRSWALELLQRHDFDPFAVRARETNFNALMGGSFDDDTRPLTELRTSWGTTVPVVDTGKRVTFSVGGRSLRADPDYLEIEWFQELPSA